MNPLNWLRSKLNRPVYVGHRQKPGWRGALPFYKFKCPKHGVVESYPTGYTGVLRCPLCDKEEEK